MGIELVSCLFELPPSDRSRRRSFNCRYDICWNCIAAMNVSYSYANALRTRATFRWSLIFSSAGCSLNTMFCRNSCQRTMIWLVLICPKVFLQILPYFESVPVFLSNDHLQTIIFEVHNDFLIQLPLNSISVCFANFFRFYIWVIIFNIG